MAPDAFSNVHSILSRLNLEAIPDDRMYLLEVNPNLEAEIIPVIDEFVVGGEQWLGDGPRLERRQALAAALRVDDASLDQTFETVDFIFNEEIADRRKFLNLLLQRLELAEPG